MDELKAIQAEPKTGNEYLTDNGEKTKYNLLGFWSWSVSDILSNATRGRFAEFIVGTAIGLNPKNLRDEWDAYDLKTDNGIKIEVKSAAYIQSWNQKKISTISFSTKHAKYWNSEIYSENEKPRRHADIYVFCHLKHLDQATIDPLKMEQWDFYVLPTFILDNYKRSQSSITINSLRRLTNPIIYNKLKTEIDKAAEEQIKQTFARSNTRCI
ncbi:MAG TPA: hypothetical protein P5084_05715 [Paludibacter sp.]|nr:hypothetical protein [Paludibacter sp.]